MNPDTGIDTLLFALSLPPEQAIAYLKQKGYAITFDWKELWQEQHALSFTVAKAMNMDILTSIRSAVEKALAEGQTFEQFRKDLTPTLQNLGWWGRVPEDQVPGLGGSSSSRASGSIEKPGKTVQLGSPYRLQTIYRTNLSIAYASGRYAQMAANTKHRPYWMYCAVMDRRTRPAHAELNGKVFKFDDPFWEKYYPPNDWGCRCWVRPLTEAEVKAMGLEISTTIEGGKNYVQVPNKFAPPEWSYNAAANPLASSQTLLYQKARDLYEQCQKNVFSSDVCPGRQSFQQSLITLKSSVDTSPDNSDLKKKFMDILIENPKADVKPVIVGFIDMDVYDFLSNVKNIVVKSPQIWITRNEIGHFYNFFGPQPTYKPSLETILRIPAIIAEPENIVWDVRKENVAYIFSAPNSRTDKLAVNVNYKDKGLGYQIVNSVITMQEVLENINDINHFIKIR